MTETLENVTDVYGLSPIQQGMLYHNISARESGVYVNQVAITPVSYTHLTLPTKA